MRDWPPASPADAIAWSRGLHTVCHKLLSSTPSLTPTDAVLKIDTLRKADAVLLLAAEEDEERRSRARREGTGADLIDEETIAASEEPTAIDTP